METHGDTPAVALQGELTIFSVAAQRERLLQSLDGPGDLVVELGEVSEVDSAGVQLLIAATKEAASRGKALHFANPSEALRDVLGLCGLAARLLGGAAAGGGELP